MKKMLTLPTDQRCVMGLAGREHMEKVFDKHLVVEKTIEKLEADFKRCCLPIECPFPIKDLGEAMKKDKKAEGAVVHFVLPERIGHVVTMDLDVDEVTGLLTQDKD